VRPEKSKQNLQWLFRIQLFVKRQIAARWLHPPVHAFRSNRRRSCSGELLQKIPRGLVLHSPRSPRALFTGFQEFATWARNSPCKKLAPYFQLGTLRPVAGESGGCDAVQQSRSTTRPADIHSFRFFCLLLRFFDLPKVQPQKSRRREPESLRSRNHRQFR